MSADSEFKDITRRLNGQSTSPFFFGFAEKPLRGFMTGNWYPGSSNEDQYPGSYTLEVDEGNSRYGRITFYLLKMISTISSQT